MPRHSYLVILFAMIMFSLSLVSAQSINITFPINNANLSTTNILINHTLSDLNYSNYNYSCYYIFNSAQSPSDALTCLNNFTVTGIQGSNNITFYVNRYYIDDTTNETISQINLTSVIFNIDSVAPVITIPFPVADSQYNGTIGNINFTVSDLHLQTCWYSINNGITNATVSCTSNITTLVSLEGSNTWRIDANDSFGNIRSQSVTFITDTIKPLLESIDVYITYNTAKIHYHSNESVNVIINYGTVSTSLNKSRSGYGTSDDIILPGLIASTTYYYNMSICDHAGNCYIRAINSFITNVTSLCNTTYVCTAWTACISGQQSRTCSKIDQSCYAPILSVGELNRACVVVPVDVNNSALTTVNPIVNNTNSTKSGSGFISGLSTMWKIVLAIVIGLLLLWIIYKGYLFFKSSSSPNGDYPDGVTPEEVEEFLDRDE